MLDLREQLQHLFQGRICLVGLGNDAYGDDGLGVRLAERVEAEGRSEQVEVVVAGTAPERWISRVADEGFDQVVFVDAVEFGGTPGSVVLLSSDEIVARYPQISTHKLSLGLLAKQAEANGRTKAWLLGVQPQSLKPGEGLSPTVRATLQLLLDLVGGCLGGRASSRAQTSAGQGSRGRSPSQAERVMA